MSKTNLKARISENKGKIEIVFDVRAKKEYEILEELIKFGKILKKLKDKKK